MPRPFWRRHRRYQATPESKRGLDPISAAKELAIQIVASLEVPELTRALALMVPGEHSLWAPAATVSRALTEPKTSPAEHGSRRGA